MTELTLENSPNCPTPDCPNKVCLWAGTGVCHPCSEVRLGRIEFQIRYEETHPMKEGKP